VPHTKTWCDLPDHVELRTPSPFFPPQPELDQVYYNGSAALKSSTQSRADFDGNFMYIRFFIPRGGDHYVSRTAGVNSSHRITESGINGPRLASAVALLVVRAQEVTVQELSSLSPAAAHWAEQSRMAVLTSVVLATVSRGGRGMWSLCPAYSRLLGARA
jgi:hypothetical protein